MVQTLCGLEVRICGCVVAMRDAMTDTGKAAQPNDLRWLRIKLTNDSVYPAKSVNRKNAVTTPLSWMKAISG